MNFKLNLKEQSAFSLLEVILAAAMLGTVIAMSMPMMEFMSKESSRIIAKNTLTTEVLTFFNSTRRLFHGNMLPDFDSNNLNSSGNPQLPGKHELTPMNKGDFIDINIDLVIREKLDDGTNKLVARVNKGSIQNRCINNIGKSGYGKWLPSVKALESKFKDMVWNGFNHLGYSWYSDYQYTTTFASSAKYCHPSFMFPTCSDNAALITNVSNKNINRSFPHIYQNGTISSLAVYSPIAATTCIQDDGFNSRMFLFMAFLNPHKKHQHISDDVNIKAVRDLSIEEQKNYFTWQVRSISFDNFSSYTNNVAYIFD